MKKYYQTMRHLKIASLIEATTLVILVCIAVPLKHVAGYGLPVSVLGPIHGMAFLVFIWLVIHTASSGNLNKSEIWRLLIASVIPFGGFFSVARISRQEREL